MSADSKEAKVNAESNLGTKKTRKPRVAKPKVTDCQQVMSLAQNLNITDKVAVIKELKRQVQADHAKIVSEAKVATEIIEGI